MCDERMDAMRAVRDAEYAVYVCAWCVISRNVVVWWCAMLVAKRCWQASLFGPVSWGSLSGFDTTRYGFRGGGGESQL